MASLYVFTDFDSMKFLCISSSSCLSVLISSQAPPQVDQQFPILQRCNGFLRINSSLLLPNSLKRSMSSSQNHLSACTPCSWEQFPPCYSLRTPIRNAKTHFQPIKAQERKSWTPPRGSHIFESEGWWEPAQNSKRFARPRWMTYQPH